MTGAELAPIVEAYGGVEAFAKRIGFKPRIVYYWLADERPMREPTAKLIRSLKPPKRKDRV